MKELVKFNYQYKFDNDRNLFYVDEINIDFIDGSLNYDFDPNIKIKKMKNTITLYKVSTYDLYSKEYKSSNIFQDWYILNASISDLLINNNKPVIYTSKTICEKIVPHEKYFSYFINIGYRTIELKFDNNTIIAVYENGTIYQYNTSDDQNKVSFYGNTFIAKYTLSYKYLFIEYVDQNDYAKRSYQIIDLENGNCEYHSSARNIFCVRNDIDVPNQWWPFYMTKKAFRQFNKDLYKYATPIISLHDPNKFFITPLTPYSDDVIYLESTIIDKSDNEFIMKTLIYDK